MPPRSVPDVPREPIVAGGPSLSRLVYGTWRTPPDARPEHQVAHYDASADRIVASAEASLRLLGTDRIDLFLIHRPDWLTPAAETAAGLDRLLRAGKILAAGVSNYAVAQVAALEAALGRPLATNQIELSLFRMDPLFDGTLSDCERRGMRPMAWSPLGGGRLFDEADEAAARVRAACREMAPRYDGAGAEALAIAWLLALPSRPLVVLGTNRTERIRAATAAIAAPLDRQDWYRLWEAAQGRRIP